MATAIGEPSAISPEAMKNISHTIAHGLPRTSLSAESMITSVVPLTLAMPNSKVSPTTITNRSEGKKDSISSMEIPETQPPTAKAAPKPSRPMFTGFVVAIAKMATRASAEIR